jgi:hypothetical protein
MEHIPTRTFVSIDFGKLANAVANDRASIAFIADDEGSERPLRSRMITTHGVCR